MSDFAELLKGIAALAWPCAFVIAVVLFRGEIRSLLSRIRKGRILGQEIELDKSLDALERDSSQAAQSIPATVATDLGATDGVEQQILSEASRSPKVGLILLSAELERAVHILMASMGHRPAGAAPLPVRRALTELVSRRMLPEPLGGSIQQFAEIRNRIVHGGQATADEAIRALDSGLTLLRAVRAVPHEVNVVSHPGVPVFSDPEGTKVRQGVLAVILETTSAGGASKTSRVFPTTRADYAKGQRVSWEWNPTQTYGESWYRDPETREIKYGWTDSMEFVGKAVQ